MSDAEKIQELAIDKLRNSVNRESQFQKLFFSQDAHSLQQIHAEINSDIDMFLKCLKNTVYYGSGISRFYNQELDICRRRFLDLEEEKRCWSQLVFKHIQSEVVSIPAPRMHDEIENRSAIAKKVKMFDAVMNGIKKEST